MSNPSPPLERPLYGASFGQAFARFWKGGVRFSGRASPSEYWLAWVATTGIFIALYLGGNALSFTSAYGWGTVFTVAAFLYGLAIVIPSIALSVRRLHDANMSGAMYLLSLIPFVGGLILFILILQSPHPFGARFDAPAVNVGYVPGIAVPPRGPEAPAASTQMSPHIPVPPPPVAAASFAAVPPPPPPPPLPTVAAAPVPLAPRSEPEMPGLRSTGLVDETRRSVPAYGVSLTLPDGRTLSDGVYVFGRDPVASGVAHGVAVPIDDPSRSASKTHARIDVSASGVTVTDLHSTNGTSIVYAGTRLHVVPGTPTPVATDAEVAIGEYTIRVEWVR